MASLILLAVLAGCVAYFILNILTLLANYHAAQKTGFPVLLSPINPHNAIWMVLNGGFLHVFSRHMPDFLWLRIRHTMHGWEFAENKKAGGLKAPAGAFLSVSSGGLELVVEDEKIMSQITQQSSGFDQSRITTWLIGILGPNVMTVNGKDWQRHRKIVTSAMGERFCKLVWSESINQAQVLSQKHHQSASTKTDQTVDDLQNIAINVIASCGYGASWNETEAAPGHALTWVEVLKTLTTGFMLVALTGHQLLCSSWMPLPIQKFGLAAVEFPKYTRELLERENSDDITTQKSKRTFLEQLIKSLQHGNGQTNSQLTMSEFQGSLFQFTLAGFETTANTLSYAVARLAVDPDLQAWVAQEAEQVHTSGNVTYEDTFPKLKRCLALMLETLRLYTPVANTSRTTVGDQIVYSGSKSLLVPDKTLVILEFARTHVSDEYWKDPFVFRPDRWISKDSQTLEENVIPLPRGIFVPWSSGARVCPGMKMAQVEFVAAISTLLSQFVISPAVSKGETLAQAQTRIYEVLEDSQPRLTLQMNRPKDLVLEWTPKAQKG